MPDIALAAELRAERGSSSSRRIRSDGRVPAVLYGHGHDAVAISLDARDLRVALNAGGSVLFSLRVGGEDHLAICREIQRHPVRHTVSHVDFQIVRRDEVIPADVPVVLVGEALAVTRAGGLLEHALQSVRVHAKPADVPAAIEVDVTDLELGSTVRVADLAIPAGVSLELDGDTPVVVAAAPRGLLAEGGEAVEAEGGETVEAAEAAGVATVSGEASEADESSEPGEEG